MLSISELINFATEFNEKIESTVIGMSVVDVFYVETDGINTRLNFGSPIFWTNEDDKEVLDSKENIKEALLKELKAQKVQIDGMIEMLEKKSLIKNN